MSREPVMSKRIRRKSHKKRNEPSVNKYAHLVPRRPSAYNPRDKTFRDLPITGEPGEVVKAGLRVIFHGRLYALMEDMIIPDGAPLAFGEHSGNKRETVGRFRMIAQID